MKEAYYFSHDANARHDDKILELRAEFGWEGYGMFWAIIETLRDCSNYTFPSNAKAGLALSLSIDKTKLETFISKCINLGLFIEEDGAFYSESLMRRMEDIDEKRRKRAEAGRKGGKAKAMLKQSPSKVLAKASKESKVKESKEDKSSSSGSDEPQKLHAFIALFNELTGRQFKSITAKTERQLKKLKKDGYNLSDFKSAILNGNKSAARWDDPALFTPEYITREDKFVTFLNWQKSVPVSDQKEVSAFTTLEEKDDYWGGRNPNFKPQPEAA